MGKVEWNNTLQLLKIRKRESKSFLYISILLIILFVASTISTILQIFDNSDTINYVVMEIYSKISFLLSITACIYFTLDYQSYNYRYEIYPSNNKTSFVSYMLYCYIFFVKVQIIALLLHIAQYGIISLIGLLRGNILFAYKFDILFLITGFFIYLLYGFLVASLIIFLGSLNRKYSGILKYLFVIIVALRSYFYNEIIYIIDNLVINIIVKESSVLKFIIKTVSICLGLIVLSMILNQSSAINKKEKNYGFITLIACIGIFIFLSNFSYGTSSATMINEVENEIYDDQLYDDELYKKNICVVLMEPYYMLNQFAYFKGKGIENCKYIITGLD